MTRAWPAGVRLVGARFIRVEQAAPRMALGGTFAGLGCSAAWGVGDFAGGLAAKRHPVFLVVLLSQALGLVIVATLALATGEPLPGWRDAMLGAAAGLGGAVGVTCLYAALASGRMGIAAPITGVVAAIVPVAYAWFAEGVPSAFAIGGTFLALAGIALTSGAKAERPPARVFGLALASGLGFAVFLLLMGLSSDESFFWTLTSARAASSSAVLLLVLGTGTAWSRPGWAVAVAGLGDAAGNALYLLAKEWSSLGTAVILSSLYPIATVALARFVLKERLTWPQAVGAALMLAAIPLVTL